MNAGALRWALAPNPSAMTLDGTRSFVLGWDRPIVVDPGPAIPSHLDAILSWLGGARPQAIVLTHAHADHAGGAAAVQAATGAPIWMGESAAPLNAEVPVDRWAADGELVDCDAGVVRILATPGHAQEHICVLWQGGDAPAGGAAFVGDLLMGEGDTTLVAPPDGNLHDYLRSLDRLEATGASLLFPAHGPPIERPTDTFRRYREHRGERIRQVRDAVADRGVDDLEALVDLVYGRDIHPALRRPALGSIQAIIEYLSDPSATPGS